MASTTVPVLESFPKESIQLGVLIPNLKSPDQDGTEPLELQADDYYVAEAVDPKIFSKAGSENSIFSRFTKFLSLSQKHGGHGAVESSSTRQKVYRLKNPKKLFDQLVKQDEVKKWLENTWETHGKAYFIVGIVTRVDTEYKYDNQQISTRSAQAQAPITQAATGMPIGDELDISAGGQHQHVVKKHGTWYIPGEYVFEICYRKVKFNFIAFCQSPAVKVENAKLADNKWIVMSDNRGKCQDVEENEVMEVSLQELEESKESEDENKVRSGEIEEVQYRFSDEHAFILR